MSMVKEEPYCPGCGQSNITVNACVQWNANRQNWDVFDTFEEWYCIECDEENRKYLEWRNIE